MARFPLEQNTVQVRSGTPKPFRGVGVRWVCAGQDLTRGGGVAVKWRNV